jgi:hypothetical protein
VEDLPDPPLASVLVALPRHRLAAFPLVPDLRELTVNILSVLFAFGFALVLITVLVELYDVLRSPVVPWGVDARGELVWNPPESDQVAHGRSLHPAGKLIPPPCPPPKWKKG